MKISEKNVMMKQTHGNDDLTNDVKRVAESIALICEEYGQLDLAEKIRYDYQLKSIERFDLQKSIFYAIAKKNNINVRQQGWIKENNIIYPLVSMDEDIRKLDKLIKNIILETKNS